MGLPAFGRDVALSHFEVVITGRVNTRSLPVITRPFSCLPGNSGSIAGSSGPVI